MLYIPAGPSDYQGGEKQAMFEIGSNMTTLQYTTVGDGIQEGMETFTAELTVPPDMQAMGIFAGTPDTAMVHIVDDDSERSNGYTDMQLYKTTVPVLHTHLYLLDYRMITAWNG